MKPRLTFLRLLLVLLFAHLVAASAADAASPSDDFLTYDEFIAQIEAGAIQSATLDQFSHITGTRLVDGRPRPFSTLGATGSANDVLLTRLLKQKGVNVVLKQEIEYETDWPYTTAAFLVPIVTLILAFRINTKLNRLTASPADGSPER